MLQDNSPMQKIHLFNPDNDLAIAHFGEYYTAPAAALRIGRDLAVLPLWFSEKGAWIVGRQLADTHFQNAIMELGLEMNLLPWEAIGSTPGDIVPWGWNPSLKRKLIDAGVAEWRLPSGDELLLLKGYSSRENAVEMLRCLKKTGDFFCGESFRFQETANLLDYLLAYPDSVLKMPFSGSGRGLVWIREKITGKQTDWAKRVIKEQGCVIAEPVVEKVHDFAMEFFLENRKAVFAGYSLFQSAASGAYAGNFLLSDAAIERQLSQYIPRETLFQLKNLLEKKLPAYFPKYRGFAGVDMMICLEDGNYRIQPCVEINVRMNMGMVAHTLRERFVQDGTRGVFAIDFFKKKGEASQFHSANIKAYPLLIQEKRIAKGYLNLTPIDEHTGFVAYVIVEPT